MSQFRTRNPWYNRQNVYLMYRLMSHMIRHYETKHSELIRITESYLKDCQNQDWNTNALYLKLNTKNDLILFNSAEDLQLMNQIAFNGPITESMDFKEGWLLAMKAYDGLVRFADDIGFNHEYFYSIEELEKAAKEWRERYLPAIDVTDFHKIMSVLHSVIK